MQRKKSPPPPAKTPRRARPKARDAVNKIVIKVKTKNPLVIKTDSGGTKRSIITQKNQRKMVTKIAGKRFFL